MSDAIYFLQAGADGPVAIGSVSQARLRQRIGQLQAGNHETLLLRALVAGESETEARIIGVLAAQHRERQWFDPAALDAIPADLQRLDIPADLDAERVLADQRFHRLAYDRPGSRP